MSIVIATGYLAFSAGSSFVHSFRLASEETRLQQEIGHLQGQLDQLQQIRDYLRSDEYVEFMARRVFGLVRPGETLVVVEAPSPPPPAERDDLTWWQRLFTGD